MLITICDLKKQFCGPIALTVRGGSSSGGKSQLHWPIYPTHLIIYYLQISKDFFLHEAMHEHVHERFRLRCDIPSPTSDMWDESAGRADSWRGWRWADRRGATVVRRTIDRAKGTCPHTWTCALQQVAPPDREQTEPLSDDCAVCSLRIGISFSLWLIHIPYCYWYCNMYYM